MNAKTRLVVFILFALAAVIGYYYFFSEIREANISASERSIAYERQIVLRNEALKLSHLLSGVGETEEQINTFFLKDEEDIISFLESDTLSIRQIEAVSGAELKVTFIAQSELEDSTNIENLDLSVSAEGSWEQVYRAIEMIETLPYQVDVRRVQLEAGGSKQQPVPGGISGPDEVNQAAISVEKNDENPTNIHQSGKWSGTIIFSVKKLIDS